MPTDFPEKPRNVVHIVTKDFPQYFALVSRPRQDVATVGPEGSILVSSRIPKAQVYHKPKWVLNVVFLWWNPHNFFSLSCNFVSFKLSYFKTSMYFELFLAFALPLYFYHEIYVVGMNANSWCMFFLALQNPNKLCFGLIFAFNNGDE